MKLVDSHCHLDFDGLREDLPGVLARAAGADVGTMVTICTKLSEFDAVLEIANMADVLFCSVGVHPHEAAEEGVGNPADLIARAGHPKVVGIGETGLDYYYEHSPREAQRASFLAHIAAARETGLPLIVHARDADDDIMEILAEEHAAGAYAGVIHCFTGSRALAAKAIELGLYISFSGILTFKNAREIQEIARELPAERILVETDAPYLAPVPHRGKRNEPSFVRHTAAFLADLRGESIEKIAEITTANFRRLFRKASATLQ